MSINPKFSVTFEATPQLIQLIQDCNSENLLATKINKLIKEKQFYLIDNEKEKNKHAFSWKIIALGSCCLVGLLAYYLGFNNGIENILKRLPLDNADEIRKTLEKESQQALDSIL